jgi:hypothetical protein
MNLKVKTGLKSTRARPLGVGVLLATLLLAGRARAEEPARPEKLAVLVLGITE